MNAVRLSPFAALLLALSLPLSAAAQDAPAAETPAAETPAEEAPAASPADQFNPGEEVGAEDGPGTDYVIASEGAWEVRCVRTEDGFDPCQLYQLLQDGNGNAVAEFSMVALPEGAEAAAGATIITPLETLLTAQLTMVVDGGKARRYPFTWCAPVGCFARIGFTTAEVDQLKKGAKALVTIVPMVAPDQKVELTVSLSGFTAGYEKMKAANAETQKRAEEAQAAGGN